MSVSPVSTTTANNIATNPVTTQPASPAGVANARSSMSSAQHPISSWTAFSNFVSGIVSVIRSSLALLPFVGHLFEEASPAPRIRSEDKLRYDRVKSILDFYHPIYGLYTDERVPVRNDIVDAALTVFRQIQDPLYQAKAFYLTVTARDSTDYAARQFYNALPEESQRKFREEIFIANGRNDNNHGIGFGEHIVATDIRGRLASDAARQFARQTRT